MSGLGSNLVGLITPTMISGFNNVMQAASAQMYQGGAQPGAGAQAGAQPGADNGAKADDNIQDADFEEVK